MEVPSISFTIEGGNYEARLQRLALMTKSQSVGDVIGDALRLYEKAVDLKSQGRNLFVSQKQSLIGVLHIGPIRMDSLDRVDVADKKQMSN